MSAEVQLLYVKDRITYSPSHTAAIEGACITAAHAAHIVVITDTLVTGMGAHGVC